MLTARTILSLALESMNRLSPGEAIDADLAAVCLRRLNAIADDWSVGRAMPPQDHFTAGMANGPTVSLGAGEFSAIAPGTELIQLQADNYPMSPITMQQYNDIYLKDAPGRPEVWAYDGLATIYLYPAASGNTVQALTRTPFAQFADLDTGYVLPAGYQGAFAAALAVAMAPALLGAVTPDLIRAENRAMANIASANVRPAIINTNPLAPTCGGNVLRGWN